MHLSVLGRAFTCIAAEARITRPLCVQTAASGCSIGATPVCSGVFGFGVVRRSYHPPDTLRVWKPTSPGQRGRITVSRQHLHKGAPFGELTQGLRKAGGRTASGRISVWHQGGGHKRLYRLVDFLRPEGVESTVERVEYDPNRSARIALIKHAQADLRGDRDAARHAYVIAPEGLGVGDTLSTKPDAPVKPGMTKALRDLPSSTVVHNVELRPGLGAQLCRSAGTSVTLIKNNPGGMSLLQLPSGEQRYVSSGCRATVGVVSNALHASRVLGKAGISRHLNIRPTTRALATNPCDHPLGGKAKKNRKTPWGKVFMGVKTRRKRKPGSERIHLSRHDARALARR